MYIKTLISSLYNSDIHSKIISSGDFPEAMKIDKVIQIFKAGERNVFTNHRPVSLLSQLSKILEKRF